ncbi:MAG: Wzz/FepE/Etk N-terminal domain-containing protein [Firmicutes bacterium]|nr:Wzz/FepE/Etk N-terminal domain-containing protein [Bacillota bacterium]
MEQELELRELFAIISKRWKMIMAIFFSAIAVSTLITLYVLQPVYQANTTLLVGKPAEGSQVVIQDIQLNRQLVSTYEQIAKSNLVTNEVIKELNLSLSATDLKSKITVSQVADTEIISVIVKDDMPGRAALIANGVASAFIAKIDTIMNVSNVSIIDPAITSMVPIAPRPALNIAIAATLGIMLGIFVAFALEYLDNTIKTPKDVEQYLELPLLGIVPYYEGER